MKPENAEYNSLKTRQTVSKRASRTGMTLAMTLLIAAVSLSSFGFCALQAKTSAKKQAEHSASRTVLSDALSTMAVHLRDTVEKSTQPDEEKINQREKPEQISDETFYALKEAALTPGPDQQKAYALFLDADQYTDALLAFFLRDPDRYDFIRTWPQSADAQYQTPVSSLQESLESVPRLLQWDIRWGWQPLADTMIWVGGCGPTCLSMVASWLKQDPTLTPRVLADLDVALGDYYSGMGTSSAFFPEAAAALDLNCETLPVDTNALRQALEAGKPVILHMLPGTFTRTGHFIVATGLENGQLRINDPNSIRHSDTLWDIDAVLSECSELWAFSNPQ